MTEFSTDSAAFNDSPLADVYYAVRNELRERDPAKKSRAAHHRIALWSAWEAHKTAKDNSGLDLLKMVGLPGKQKEFAELLGVSARTIRKYQDEYAEFARTGQEMTFARLLGRYRLGAVEALGQVVTDKEHSQFAQSQRTFFTLTGDLVDKSETKNTETDWRDEVVDLLKNGRITPDDVRDEFGPEIASELIARANVASKGAA